jgi:hypothetical protein
VRAFDDQWARREAHARYQSPIARFIWEYIRHLDDGNKAAFTYDPIDEAGHTIAAHQPLVKVIDFLRSEQRRLAEGSHESLSLPEVRALVSSPNVPKELWARGLPAHVMTFVADDAAHPLHGAVSQILRLLALARYINHRMAVTVVLTKAEDHAFDMFESLNTTGQPLRPSKPSSRR